MNCREAETRLVSYMDGRATEAERHEVELHLVACTACRARVEEYGRLWTLLDEVPALEPSASFDARLRQRITTEPRRPWLAWLVPSPRFAFAAAMLVVLSVWISSMPPAPGPNTTTTTAQGVEEEFKMIKDLPVLEDYDVLANFEALSELPPPEQNKRPM